MTITPLRPSGILGIETTGTSETTAEMVPGKPLVLDTSASQNHTEASSDSLWARTVCVGDVHGQSEALTKILIQAGVIDSQNQRWIEQNPRTFVQMGDVIDRGPDSLGAYNKLLGLQADAAEKQGRVILLIGNHETELIRENWPEGPSDSDRKALRNIIIQGIKEKKLQAAWCDNDFLYVHGGFCSPLKDALILEIRKESKKEVVVLDDIVNHINTVLVNAINSGDFSHPIFFVDSIREGSASYAGIFWLDFDRSPCGREPIPQVNAHCPHLGSIVRSPSERSFDVDVGLGESDQHLAYLGIDNQGNVFSCTQKDCPGQWKIDRFAREAFQKLDRSAPLQCTQSAESAAPRFLTVLGCESVGSRRPRSSVLGALGW